MVEFLERFITADETWIHHNTLVIREQLKDWGKSRPSRAKLCLSPKEVKATCFWNACLITQINYPRKLKELFDKSYHDWKEKRPHVTKKKVRFHQDNARMIPRTGLRVASSTAIVFG